MPRPLTNADNQLSLSNWLQTEISNLNPPFTPHVSPINVIPENRGIYFWFMEPKGYEKLSRYVQISPVENRISWQIEGKTYDLVYLGTAGTNRAGLQTLLGRLKWHIHQEHSENTICNGSISTLRAGLASLLSDDLILPNSEALVNEIMEKHFKIFWVRYQGDDLIEQVDMDEEVLINTLRPLLNIKNNPNAQIIGNPTKIYKQRRNEIFTATKARLGCLKKQGGAKTAVPSAPVTTNSGSGCVEFKVSNTESVHDKIQNVKLPSADKYQIEVFSQFDKTDTIFTGKTIVPKEYFNRAHSNNVVRWRHIQTIMNDRGIKNATVVVCLLISNTRPSKVKVSIKTSPIRHSSKNKEKMKDFELKNDFKLREDDIIVISCSGGKVDIPHLLQDNQEIKFRAESNPPQTFLPYDTIPNQNPPMTWSAFIENAQNINNPALVEAFSLYQPKKAPYQNIYSDLHARFSDNLYILSAGWGLIKSSFRIPTYDITFSNQAKKEKKRSKIDAEFNSNDFKQLNPEKHQRLVCLVSQDYIPQFKRLTNHLSNEKITTSIKSVKDIPGVTKYNWYYLLAKILIENH